MDKTIRKYTNFDDMKADEYPYLQSRPAHERIDAIEVFPNLTPSSNGTGLLDYRSVEDYTI